MSHPKKKKAKTLPVMEKRARPLKGSIRDFKERLAKLYAELANGPYAPKEARLLLEIRLLESRLKIEQFHRVSKLNSVNPREILCGSPGLGKKKS